MEWLLRNSILKKMRLWKCLHLSQTEQSACLLHAFHWDLRREDHIIQEGKLAGDHSAWPGYGHFSCLVLSFLQIILQGLGNSNFNSHTFEGWWLLHYPWWNSQPTINMYFQAKNYHSLLLLENLRPRSYLLWLEGRASQLLYYRGWAQAFSCWSFGVSRTCVSFHHVGKKGATY